jgi:hypothetical protein
MKILFGGLERDLAENVKANESNRSAKWGYGVISSKKKLHLFYHNHICNLLLRVSHLKTYDLKYRRAELGTIHLTNRFCRVELGPIQILRG